MIRQRRKNVTLSETFIPKDKCQISTKISLLQYSYDFFSEKNIDSVSSIQNILNPEGVNWIKVTGFTNEEDIITLVNSFGLTRLDAQDILNTQRIIKLEESENGIFFILKHIYQNNKNELEKSHLGFILQGNTLISFQENDFNTFLPIIEALNEDKLKLRKKGADYLFICLLNIILSTATEYVVSLEDELESLEDEVIDFSSSEELLPKIQTLRKKYLILKKVIIPLKEQMGKLLRNEYQLISDNIMPFVSDLYDRLLYNIQVIESIRETLFSVLDLYVNNNDIKLNDIMKRLTVVSTIFIPLTFLVGVWGMNFNFMPELGWKHGYLAAWAIMILVGICVWIYFRKKKWY